MNRFALGGIALSSALGWSFATRSLAQSRPSDSTEQARKTTPPETGAELVVLPTSVPYPFEPFNRMMGSFNQGFMNGVIKPTRRVYRVVGVKPIRTGVGNFGKNLTYPGRLINNLLQGKWNGARDESYRFLCNTTFGVAGFFDMA